MNDIYSMIIDWAFDSIPAEQLNKWIGKMGIYWFKKDYKSVILMIITKEVK